MNRAKQIQCNLIAVAAELARGPNLDKRFELSRLPKWVLIDIERICDRQRELAIIIRVNADDLFKCCDARTITEKV